MSQLSSANKRECSCMLTAVTFHSSLQQNGKNEIRSVFVRLSLADMINIRIYSIYIRIYRNEPTEINHVRVQLYICLLLLLSQTASKFKTKKWKCMHATMLVQWIISCDQNGALEYGLYLCMQFIYWPLSHNPAAFMTFLDSDGENARSLTFRMQDSERFWSVAAVRFSFNYFHYCTRSTDRLGRYSHCYASNTRRINISS